MSPAKPFLYSAWFRNAEAASDDPDIEWPACFLITATTAAEALAWGDALAKGYSQRRVTEIFLSSTIEDAATAEGDLSKLPTVPFGCTPSDEEIGW